jgi:hypothetical protein
MLPQTETRAPVARSAPPNRYWHFAAGAVIFLLILQCAALFPSIPGSLAGNADFRNLYAAGYIVRSGQADRLYDYQLQQQIQGAVTTRPGLLPFVYPAYTALLFAPLSLLGYRGAYALFFAINLLLLWIAARLVRSSLPHLAALWTPLPITLFFCFLPATVALMHGQTSILLLTLYCAAFASLRRAKPLQAGIFLGLGIMKIQFTLPLALLFIAWRRWRVASGITCGVVAAILASLWVTGPGTFLQYWRSLLLAATDAHQSMAPMPVDMMANLFGFAQILAAGNAWGAYLAAVGALLLFVWLARRPASLALAIVGALLISRYMGVHDLTLLLLPIALTLDRFLAQRDEARARAGAVLCLVLLFPPVYRLLLVWRLVACLVIVLLPLLAFLPPPLQQTSEPITAPESPDL